MLSTFQSQLAIACGEQMIEALLRFGGVIGLFHQLVNQFAPKKQRQVNTGMQSGQSCGIRGRLLKQRASSQAHSTLLKWGLAETKLGSAWSLFLDSCIQRGEHGMAAIERDVLVSWLQNTWRDRRRNS